MAIVLGLDLGTTAVKGLLCSETGQILAAGDQPIALLQPRPGWVEQDMEHLWDAVGPAQQYLMTNDFVLHRLCGHRAMDPSDASSSGFYDQAGERWHRAYLDLLAMPAKVLSSLLPRGEALGTLTWRQLCCWGRPPAPSSLMAPTTRHARVSAGDILARTKPAPVDERN